MRRILAFTAVMALLLAAPTACTGRGAPSNKPDPIASPSAAPTPADGLLREAAAELRTVRTMRFALAADGTAGLVGVRTADGRVTSAGDADGTASLDQSGTPAEFSFVVKQDDLYLKGLTGSDWQRVPLSAAASLYDPSALLSPERGVANVVATATGTIDGREALGGVETYRVTAKLNGDAIGVLAPGMGADAAATLWIGVDRRVVYKANFVAPGQAGQVTVTFSDFDAPVAIKTP